MHKYSKDKAGWRDCFVDEKKGFLFNWNSYENEIRDNSIDLKSSKSPIYPWKKSQKDDSNWRITYFPTQLKPSLEDEFKELAEKWKFETALFSIDRDRVNDTFLDIISLGKPVIPFILNDILKYNKAARWHLALKTLTKANPVPFEDLKDSNKIKDEWIKWGRVNNLI